MHASVGCEIDSAAPKQLQQPPQTRSGKILLPSEHLVAMRKYWPVLQEACFAFCDSDGNADRAMELLFSLTPEVLGAPDRSGRSPVGAAVAARSWTAAGRLLALTEAARNPHATWRRAPDTGEDALALAICAEPPADEAILRRLVRHRALHCGCRCCCYCRGGGGGGGKSESSDCCHLGVDRRGRNLLHAAAAAAAAGRRCVLNLVLDELGAVLDLLEQRCSQVTRRELATPTDADRPPSQTGQHRQAEEDEDDDEPDDAADEAGSEAQLQRLRESLTEALNSTDVEGWTPVHRMARGGGPGGLRKLMDLAARHRLRPDWEARQAGGRGLSPLAAAAEAGNVEACELLLAGGLARVNLEDDQWMRAAPAPSVQRLLGRHSRRLLEPLAEAPRGSLRRLAAGLGPGLVSSLRDGLAELMAGASESLPQPDGPLEDWLAGLDGHSGAARLAVWRLLRQLGQPGLASLLEDGQDS